MKFLYQQNITQVIYRTNLCQLYCNVVFLCMVSGSSFLKIIPQCSNEDRLLMIQQFCKQQKIAEKFMYRFPNIKSSQKELQQSHTNSSYIMNILSQTDADYLDAIPDKEIISIAHELWKDPVNQVIICMHAKAGCSTWKTILANNVGNTTLSKYFIPYIHSEVFKRGMKCADEGNNATEIRHRLRTWYKFAIVRHPFDR